MLFGVYMLACAMESVGGLADETSTMYKTNMG